MKSHSMIWLMSVLGIAVAFYFWASSLLAVQETDKTSERPVCVGVATARLRSDNPVIARVYRVFSDGTVETYDHGAPNANWTRLGK